MNDSFADMGGNGLSAMPEVDDLLRVTDGPTLVDGGLADMAVVGGQHGIGALEPIDQPRVDDGAAVAAAAGCQEAAVPAVRRRQPYLGLDV